MKTREKILLLLEQNRGSFFSGEELADTFSLTRAAVWKAVKHLQEEGYRIEAVRNKGYCLAADTDILSPQGIEKYLSSGQKQLKLSVLSQVESTNSHLREAAAQGAPEGTVLAAGCQSAGRGRQGRSFYSPAGTGLYLSLLLRPFMATPKDGTRFTTMAAVAACQAVETLSGQKPGIKWVNDLYLYGRKIAGILTEASVELETGLLEYAVLGAGFNLYPPEEGFPEELASIAGSIFPSPGGDNKNHLAALFLRYFWDWYQNPDPKSYVEEYRRRSLVLGKQIQVLSASGTRSALALDVDEDCRLLVRFENGETARLSSGEIRIRLEDDGD